MEKSAMKLRNYYQWTIIYPYKDSTGYPVSFITASYYQPGCNFLTKGWMPGVKITCLRKTKIKCRAPDINTPFSLLLVAEDKNNRL